MFGLLAAKFIPHNLLKMENQSNQIIPADILTVLCEITIDGKDVQQSGNKQQEVKPPMKLCLDKLSGDFSKLLEGGQFSDITIVCETEEKEVVKIPVHKAVLGARSPVFNAMFAHNMSEAQTKEVNIIDLNLPTVRDMLSYMYVGKIEDLNTRSLCLLEAADKYQLSELKAGCINFLILLAGGGGVIKSVLEEYQVWK